MSLRDAPRPSAALYRIPGQRAVSRITQFSPPLIGLAPFVRLLDRGVAHFVKGGRPFPFLDDFAWPVIFRKIMLLQC